MNNLLQQHPVNSTVNPYVNCPMQTKSSVDTTKYPKSLTTTANTSVSCFGKLGKLCAKLFGIKSKSSKNYTEFLPAQSLIHSKKPVTQKNVGFIMPTKNGDIKSYGKLTLPIAILLKDSQGNLSNLNMHLPDQLTWLQDLQAIVQKTDPSLSVTKEGLSSLLGSITTGFCANEEDTSFTIGLNVDDLNYFRGKQITQKSRTVLPPAMSTIAE